MKTKKLITIAIAAAVTAIIVVVVLKLLGQENAVVTGGAVAGAISGALIATLRKK